MKNEETVLDEKQNWITPTLIEYGDVTKVTKQKGFGSWDGTAIQLKEQDWVSGCVPND